MATFTYKALAADGTEIKGTTDASSEARAIQQLSDQSYAVYEIIEGHLYQSTPWYRRELFRSAHLSDQDIVALSLSLSAMLAQHIPIDEALNITSETSQRRPIEQSLEQVRSQVATGVSIGKSFETLHTTFPQEFLSMIRAGERSNTLASSLDAAAVYFTRRSRMKQSLLSATAYPVFLIFAAIIVFLVILLTMVPALYDTLASAGSEISGTIAYLHGISVFLSQYWAACLAVVGFVSLSALVARSTLQKLLLFVCPPLKRNQSERVYAQAARMLQTMLQSGEQLDRALSDTIDVSGTSSLEEPLRNALASITRGESAGPGFLNDKSVPTAFARLFDLGERTNNLPSLLQLAGDSLEASHENALKRMTGLLTPVLTLLVGGIIALLVQVLISAVLEVSQVAV